MRLFANDRSLKLVYRMNVYQKFSSMYGYDKFITLLSHFSPYILMGLCYSTFNLYQNNIHLFCQLFYWVKRKKKWWQKYEVFLIFGYMWIIIIHYFLTFDYPNFLIVFSVSLESRSFSLFLLSSLHGGGGWSQPILPQL